VALSLASFAGRQNRAWPGAPAASARAGLSRSRYQQARELLVARGLLVVEERATGRGRASTVTLVFADTGPWWDGDINVELFEAVLAYSTARGPKRLLLATMAAVADDEGVLRDLSTEQLRVAAGIADRTYRRVRTALLASGSVDLVNGLGGRGNTNVWMVRDPRERGDAVPGRVPRRVPPPTGTRPLIASTASPAAAAQVDEPAAETAGKGGQDRTLTAGNSPILTGVSAQKGGQDQTLFDLAPIESPAQTPAETPAANARAGREPLNPRIREDPPSPPVGGSPPDSIVVEETYVTARGRKRRRAVRIDLDEVRRRLGIPSVADRDDWEQIRTRVREVVGDSSFEIWLDPLQLIAIDRAGVLVIAAPATTNSWVETRFGRLLSRSGEQESRAVRFADGRERQAFGRQDRAHDSGVSAVHIKQREVS
jgi:hypothetical protein